MAYNSTGYAGNLCNKTLDDRYRDYDVMGEGKEIHKVVIDGIEFSGYKAFTFLWEKSYVREPTRSSNGVIGNLNSYATFVTPHLKIDFALMPIEDYRKLYKLLLSRNEFQVTCYDVINNERTTNKMYFATDQFPTLYMVARQLANGTDFIELTGVRDYTVELIGTNNEIDKVSIVYNSNYPSGSGKLNITEGENDEYYVGDEITVGSNSSIPTNAPTGWQFKCWTTESGGEIDNGTILRITDLYKNGVTLKAEWQPTKTRNLHFNYGLSAVATKTDDNGVVTEIQDTDVQYDESIGTLPNITESPEVTYNNEKYYPYHGGAWYRGDSLDSTVVNDNDRYWSNYNTTIYCLYKTYSYDINFITGQQGYYLPCTAYPYNAKVVLPNLGDVNGKVFKGWYTDEECTTKFESGSHMPPFPLSLYAKWE